MNLSEERLSFRDQKNRPQPVRMLVWAILIVSCIWLLVQLDSGQIKPLFFPTPIPTRTGQSWQAEGKTRYEAGDLVGAINAYQQAVVLEPSNDAYLAELAQIQAYSSALLTTDQDRYLRLQEAQSSIDRAVQINPQNSNAFAIQAFILDWLANPAFGITQDERARLLNDAENAAVRASQLDRQNTLALVYYAEVLLDQQKWSQALETIQAALQKDSTSMDVHRVHGQILETFALYEEAIDAYKNAALIAPNMTFLYIYIGVNYRTLGSDYQLSGNPDAEAVSKELFNKALEYFDKAAKINQVIGVNDPVPYIAIAKTYVQQGEFFIAARNAEKALSLSPSDPTTYGQLGDIYVRARNYEGALPVLRCAVYGCSAQENEAAIEILGAGVDIQGLPLTSLEVAYFYLRYGSVLAALDKCAEAEPVLLQVMEKYGFDKVISDIVAENRAICSILGEN